MRNAAYSTAFGLIFWVGMGTTASAFTLPDFDACRSTRDSAYQAGFADGAASTQQQCQTNADGAYGQGVTDGTSSGVSFCQQDPVACGIADRYDQGVSDGSDLGVRLCLQDPSACGITLGSVLGQGGYGEIEPNDNIVSANPLVGGVKFFGQTYGPEDEDWYYLVTSRPNQIAAIHFSVPGRDPETSDVSDWIVEVMDAAGNRYASFQTDFLAGNAGGDDEINYPVTIGLVGTYYLVVKPASDVVSGDPYVVAVTLRDSDLTSVPLVVNFFDSEVEPNDWPTDANPIATGVTMYGLINLQFEQAVPRDSTFVWGQGEDDWYVYSSGGEEIVSLSFCEREACSAGNWFVDVFDAAGAAAVDAGEQADALMAFNTDTTADPPQTIRFGLSAPGNYYMRVNHKQKFEASCIGYARDDNNDGLVDPAQTPCGCDSGYSCPISIPVPAGTTVCPDGAALEIPAEADAPAVGQQCEATCRCVSFGRILEVPEDSTSQYNFTWFGTKLAPFTVDSPAYDAFLARPAWYAK